MSGDNMISFEETHLNADHILIYIERGKIVISAAADSLQRVVIDPKDSEIIEAWIRLKADELRNINGKVQ